MLGSSHLRPVSSMRGLLMNNALGGDGGLGILTSPRCSLPDFCSCSSVLHIVSRFERKGEGEI